MSSATTGAASAAPGLADLADQIRTEITAAEDGHRAALQHAIRAGELLTEAKARMVHGEWLPWLEMNFSATPRLAQQYMVLAANTKRVSHLGSVREALAAIKQPKAKAKRKRRELKENRAKIHDPDVIRWIAKCDRAGMGRDEIMEASEQGTREWPRPGEKLTRVNVDEVRAIAEHERITHEENKRKPPSEGGTRSRQLHADKRAGRRDPESDLWKMQVAIAETIGVLERIELPDVEWNEDVGHLLNEVVYDLERHRAWSDRQFDAAWARMDDIGRQRRLNELRKRAADPSSTQSERETAANLLEKHERKYREQKALVQKGESA